jgi:hypothetical protein
VTWDSLNTWLLNTFFSIGKYLGNKRQRGQKRIVQRKKEGRMLSKTNYKENPKKFPPLTKKKAIPFPTLTV